LLCNGDFPGDPINLQIRLSEFVGEIGVMGHGLQMWLQIVWFLVQNKDADTIILDEPDVYLHADIQRKLIRLLKRSFKQTIITTHSTEIMSEADPEHILIIDKSKNTSSHANSLPTVQQIIDHVGSAHNIHLFRIWSAKKIIFVEGKDISYLKKLQDKLFPDSDHPFDSVPNISIGGWTGWIQVTKSSLTFKNAMGNSINIYCILDSDYHIPDEILKRYKEATDHSIKLHIWRKKEIENYFLETNAIARVINNHGHNIDKNEISIQITTICEKLEPNIISNIADSYISQNRGATVNPAIQFANKLISEKRGNEAYWDLFSGKDIFRELSRWLQESYSISISIPAVIKEIRPEEIEPELAQVISAIEYCTNLIMEPAPAPKSSAPRHRV
jgi:predicted ATP-dependent endonuclease of OLD family